jgi:hypothetical protein
MKAKTGHMGENSLRAFNNNSIEHPFNSNVITEQDRSSKINPIVSVEKFFYDDPNIPWLQVGLATVNRDISYLRNQAKANIKRYVDERLPEEYETST